MQKKQCHRLNMKRSWYGTSCFFHFICHFIDLNIAHTESPLLAELKDTIFRHLFCHLQIGGTFSNQFYKLGFELMYLFTDDEILLSLQSTYRPFDYKLFVNYRDWYCGTLYIIQWKEIYDWALYINLLSFWKSMFCLS